MYKLRTWKNDGLHRPPLSKQTSPGNDRKLEEEKRKADADGRLYSW